MPASQTLQHNFIYRWRLPITVIALLGGWLGALFSAPWISEYSPADLWLDGVAWLLLAAGVLLRAWASREISGRKRISIVNTGPYALCRNPLYWGTLLLGVSQLFFLRSPIFLFALLVPVGVYLYGVIPVEEQFLTNVLGAEYQAYCQQTPRWWPHWNPNVWVSLGVQDHKAYTRELWTLVCWLSLPLLAELISHCRELPNWPHLALLF